MHRCWEHLFLNQRLEGFVFFDGLNEFRDVDHTVSISVDTVHDGLNICDVKLVAVIVLQQGTQLSQGDHPVSIGVQIVEHPLG